MAAPTTRADFDRAYRAPITFWGDVRIPAEVKSLARQRSPGSALELGCGVGRFSRYLAQQGLRVTGVDFSPVAIAEARKRVARDDVRPEFLVGDVTHLDALRGPFDVSFDVGCFHCLDAQGQQAYASEVFRLLEPGGTHLIWALDSAPSDLALSPAAVKELFATGFELQNARKSRRRLARSHWYWLVRSLR
jgi:cyclopropane fatty-acyl-phospholipid synthase-like methyltransferase